LAGLPAGTTMRAGATGVAFREEQGSGTRRAHGVEERRRTSTGRPRHPPAVEVEPRSVTWVELLLAAGAASLVTAGVQSHRRRATIPESEQRQQALVRLLGDLAAAANEAATPDDALRTSLRLICRYGGWALGHVVTFEPGTALVKTIDSFWETSNDPGFAPFIEQFAHYQYWKMTGNFLGRCLREQRPTWMTDIARNSQGPRTLALRAVGVQSGLAFPVLLHGEIAALLEFLAREPREPDPLFLDNIANIGAQLSRPVERHRAAATHARLAAIVASSEDAIISRGLDYRILSWNPAAERLFGYTADEAIGKDIALLIPPEFGQEVAHNREALAQGGSIKTYDTVRVTKDGRRIDVSLTLSPIRDDAGRMIGNSLILRDITERKRAEQRIERLTRFYAALSETSEAVMRITDRDELFQRVCEMAVEKGNLALAWIGLVDWAAQAVREAAAAGAGVSYVAGACERIAAARLQASTPTATAIRENVPQILNEAPAPVPAWREMAERHGIRALAIMPLTQDGKVTGALCLYAREWGFFDEELVLLLQKIAQNVSFALDNFVRESQRRLAEEHVRHLAHHDPLTGLPNRSLLTDRLAVAIGHARRHGNRLALLFVDLDRFKLINDSLGHAVGDEVLKMVAQRLTASVRVSDTIGRHGGDEFLVLLPEISHVEDAARVAEKILEAMTHPCVVEHHELATGASIGIAICPDNGEDLTQLLRNADAAMYWAKQSGRDRYQFYSETMNARASERLQLEHDLRYAVERGELWLAYQPQVLIATGELVGIEALARWRHPKLGLVPPDRFIPLAEESGLILRIGEWCLRVACEQRIRWSALPAAVRICVNVSAIQFRQPDFAQSLKDLLAASGLPAHNIELELTESIAMQGGQVMRALTELSREGLTLAIDDFGAGYSSLSYLRHLPIHRLKVDRSFILDLGASEDAVAITRAILNMGRTLGLDVIAEGVETQAQADLLRDAGCDRAQGYYYCEPLAARELEAWLAARGYGTGETAAGAGSA
jgi:diguanylate cyclase (GGDEF)-like protein/PAS domain S-box-containing protein